MWIAFEWRPAPYEVLSNENFVNKTRFHSFLKVGGGFAAADYARIRLASLRRVLTCPRHFTEGHWNDWDPNHPPTEYIELADAKQTFERPDQWIKPDE